MLLLLFYIGSAVPSADGHIHPPRRRRQRRPEPPPEPLLDDEDAILVLEVL